MEGAEDKFQEVVVTTENNKTFCIRDEDHTLGNSLRHVLMQDENVSFCGYSMPHPSEPKLHMRVQTSGKKGANEVLEAGVQTLSDACDHVISVADAAVASFKAKQ